MQGGLELRSKINPPIAVCYIVVCAFGVGFSLSHPPNGRVAGDVAPLRFATRLNPTVGAHIENPTLNTDNPMRYFRMSERFWMNLQTRYDLEMEKDRLEGRLEEEVQVYAAAA
jgi:hypothetical protein